MKIIVKNTIINKVYYKEIDSYPFVGIYMEGGIVSYFGLYDFKNKDGFIYKQEWLVVISKEDFIPKILRKLGF